MLKRCISLCAVLILLTICDTGWPRQNSAFDDALLWQEYPDVVMLSSPTTIAEMFPDYSDDVLLSAEYAEYQPYYSPTDGLVTCVSRRDAYLALIYYSWNGDAFIHAAGLPLPFGHETILSYSLDGDVPGLTRLLLWRNPPEYNWLRMLAEHPTRTAEQVPGVLAQRWFEGGWNVVMTQPWNEPWQEYGSGLSEKNAPNRLLCFARPTMAGTVVAKDCAVFFNGMVSVSMDNYGMRAYWELDWATNLEIVMVLPAHYEGTEIDLRLFVDSEDGSSALFTPEIEVTVNGWFLSEMDVLPVFYEPDEPIAHSLSRYTVAGENRIVMSNNSLAGTSLRLGVIEMWTY